LINNADLKALNADSDEAERLNGEIQNLLGKLESI